MPLRLKFLYSSLMDIIAEDDNIIDRIDLRIRTEQLYRYVGEVLTPRERRIIEMRYGLFGRPPMTQREVAARLHISRSYVSRIEKKALGALRQRFGGQTDAEHPPVPPR